MITELKPGKYKLVDKEGYLNAYPRNPALYIEFFTDKVVEISEIDGAGYGYHEKRMEAVIVPNEYKFFEPYEEPTEEPVLPEPHYWDGKEEFEVGMVVDYYGAEEEIVAIRGEEFCITFNDHLCITNILNLVPVKPEHTLVEKQRKLLEETLLKFYGGTPAGGMTGISPQDVCEFAEAWKEL
jgi:hypothetical protein